MDLRFFLGCVRPWIEGLQMLLRCASFKLPDLLLEQGKGVLGVQLDSK